MSSPVLNFESFIQLEGIYVKTIEDLFNCEIFYLARESMHVNFFEHFMADDASCMALQKLLFELALAYHESYLKNVSSTSGDIEKRMKAGKIMVMKFENDRRIAKELCKKKFVSLQVVRVLFDVPENEQRNRSVYEESNLLYCYLEKFLYTNFWSWHHHSRGLDVSNYIIERSSDITYNYSETMLHKVYDITGYLCGHRIYNLIHLNRLRSDYKEVFQIYYSYSRHSCGRTAISCGLPAEYTLFREHSEGLYYPKAENFVFIKIIQAIWMQSLSTDVLILFNAFEPVKLVHKVILNSKNVQIAFKNSCVMLLDHFKEGIDLATDDNPISFLFQFIINGFIRTYAKDIYQLRLSNSLLSKTGASGIRTNLLSHSAKASSMNESKNSCHVGAPVKSKSSKSKNIINTSSSLSCSCGRNYIKESWYKRHIATCSVYINNVSVGDAVLMSIDPESILLDNLIDLEGNEELGEYPDTNEEEFYRSAERLMEEEENDFDSKFSAHLLVDDIDE